MRLRGGGPWVVHDFETLVDFTDLLLMKWKESIKDTPHLNSFLHILMLLKWFRRIFRHFGRENPNIFNHCGGRSFRWIIRQNFMLNTFYESLVHLHEKYFWQPRSLWDNLNSNGLLIVRGKLPHKITEINPFSFSGKFFFFWTDFEGKKPLKSESTKSWHSPKKIRSTSQPWKIPSFSISSVDITV